MKKRFVLYHLPAIFFAMLIFALSSLSTTPAFLSEIIGADKLLHGVMYAGWMVMWWWFLSAGGRRVTRTAAAWLIVGGAAYGVFDEMTQAIVDRQPDVLLVPMAALRFAPAVTAAADRSGSGLLGYILPRRPSEQHQKVDGSSLWILRDGQPVKVSVTPGASDGRMIAVASDDLKEGDLVITDQRGSD